MSIQPGMTIGDIAGLEDALPITPEVPVAPVVTTTKNNNKTLKRLQEAQAADERRAVKTTDKKKQDEIMARINRRQEKIDAAEGAITKPKTPVITPDEEDTGDIIIGDSGDRTTETDPFKLQREADLLREATNARAIFDSIFKQYFNRPGDDRFISDLTKFVEDSLSKGYTADTISALLPQTEAYKTRFKGNEGRIKAGLAAYSPAEYLQAEDTYAEILNRFNLGDLATRDQFADFIGNRKSASEVADLVQNVYFRINNADPALRQQLNDLKIFGGLTDSDLAKAILTGPEGAQVLKQKIAGAEVGTEAAARGLSPIRSQQLANLGVTREQARAGFEAIAQTQPTFEKLSDIYEPMTAPQTRESRAARSATIQEELEKEQFQGLRSENRARLAQQEQAAFMGQSGTQGIGIRRRSQRGLI